MTTTTNPPSAAQLLALLRAEGLTVVEVGDWEHHNRNHKGPFGPMAGVMIHHTVTRGTAATVRICKDGYAALPGPLCHGVIAKNGTIHLVGYGRANHAGGGDPAVLAAVKAGTYATRPPVPVRGNDDGVVGNAFFWGFECENLGDGKDPWPAAQLLAIEKASAALCRYHGWNERHVIGHLEWSDDKSDPRGFTMPSMRARIKNRLSPAKPKKYHTVVAGDTLYAIGQRYKVTVAVLTKLNPAIKDSNIGIGDKVRYA